MTDIRYYPLVDCDTEGTEKVAMFPSLDRDTIMAQSSLWLEEMVPNYFRLRCHPGQFPSNEFTIRCPHFGKPLARISEAINENTRALYVCNACAKK